MHRALLLALLVFGAACSGTPQGQSLPGRSQAVPAPSRSQQESEPSESSQEEDGGAPLADAAASDDILGTLGGSCGAVRALLADQSPALLDNELSFASGEAYARAALSAEGVRLFDTANAGGSSTESEVMSFEVLRFCEGASLVKTETEIEYRAPDDAGANSITDILVSIGGQKVGVSVTRAYKPARQTLTDDDVRDLLEKKLAGVNRSSQRVVSADKWVKQILHVFVATQAAADAVHRVWPDIDASLRADTVVLLTRTMGGGFIYCNPDPPLGSECP